MSRGELELIRSVEQEQELKRMLMFFSHTSPAVRERMALQNGNLVICGYCSFRFSGSYSSTCPQCGH